MINISKKFKEKNNSFLFYLSIFSHEIDLFVALKFLSKLKIFLKKISNITNFSLNINNAFPLKYNYISFKFNAIHVRTDFFSNTDYIYHNRRSLKNIYYTIKLITYSQKLISSFLKKLETIVLAFKKEVEFFVLEKCEFQKKINYFEYHLLNKYLIKFTLCKNKTYNLPTFTFFSLERKLKSKKKNLKRPFNYNIKLHPCKIFPQSSYFYWGFESFHLVEKSISRSLNSVFVFQDQDDYFLDRERKNSILCESNFLLSKLWSFNHEILSIIDYRHLKKKDFTLILSKNKFDLRISEKNFLLINNKTYLKLEMVGKGGSGKVYKIIRKDRKIFALKKSKIEENGLQMINNFINEITILKFLSGKRRIIQIQDAEINFKKKLIFIILEFGEFDLEFFFKNAKKVILPTDIKWFWKQILETVQEIHEERVVHGDLKPSNFLFIKHSLKLIDFGISKIIKNNTTNITRDIHAGTLNYMSPEAILEIPGVLNELPKFKTSRASDIWSLGCILFQLSQGHPPFWEFSLIQKINAIVNNSLKIRYFSSVDFLQFDVINNCLKRQPDLRPNISELLIHPFLKIS